MFFETPISRESGVSPPTRGASPVADELAKKFEWPETMRVELMHSPTVSGQIHMRRACGLMGDCSGSDLLLRCRLVLTRPSMYLVSLFGTWIYYFWWLLLPTTLLPKVYARFFESLPSEGTF